MSYLQDPPRLGNQYDDDPTLRSYLRRALPAERLAQIEPQLRELGELAGGSLYQLQLADRPNEPRLTQWSGWGERIDKIELTPLWQEAERLAAQHGLVAIPYERNGDRYSRVQQFALAYLFTPSTDIYSCPLAMTDGAARTLHDSGNHSLVERALPHLTSRDPEQFWTSGQWMTETVGGSDVSGTQTVARQQPDGGWRLYGSKWFTSAATSQVALTLARPEGNPAGGKGLALFYLEPRDERGQLRGIRVRRLKDKLGTRKLPTAELELHGVPAIPVGGLANGVRAITPMLNITRTWNAVSAISYMRRGLALAYDYAGRRYAFGRRLIDLPLHADTLADLRAEFAGAFQLTFRVVELLGQAEHGELDEAGLRLLRILTPIAKLTTGRQVVEITSECLEAFGGAGYVEDTGLPALLRDAQVLSIWEGTTNVLALETLRAIGDDAGARLLAEESERYLADAANPHLEEVVGIARSASVHALEWLQRASRHGRDTVEAGARRFALTLGRALELALLARHASWSLEQESDDDALNSARRLAASGIDRIRPLAP